MNEPRPTGATHRGDLDAGRSPLDPIRILSIDGGGMRGLIPLRILVELERLSGRPIAGLFDVIAGTSTGGMIALALACPGPGGRPRYSAQDVLDTYLNQGRTIFPRPQFRPLRVEHLRKSRPIVAQRLGALAYPGRFGNARYTAAGLEAVLARTFGDTRLSEAMADVIVPSYDWKAGRSFIFRSRGAREGTLFDPRMAQVARATSAAPTYFPALRLQGPQGELVLIDGGLVANNPASVAYYEALYRATVEERRDPEFLIVSLGTGRPPEEIPTYQELWSRSWLRMAVGMLGVMFDGTSEVVDELLTEVVRPRHPHSRYWRLNTELRGVRLNLDETTAQQQKRLVALAERMIEEHQGDLDDMIGLLSTSSSAAPAPPRGSPTTGSRSGRRSGGSRRRRSTG